MEPKPNYSTHEEKGTRKGKEGTRKPKPNYSIHYYYKIGLVFLEECFLHDYRYINNIE